MDQYLFEFKEHLKTLNRSGKTITTYMDHTHYFFNCTKIDDVRKVTPSVVKKYINGLYEFKSVKGKPYSLNTICVKVRALKRFFEYLENSNVILINPAETIKEPKIEKRLPKAILSPDEARLILDQPDITTLTGIRDRTILELFYSTGMRLSELCNLTIYDVDLQDKVARINKGKGSKDRMVPFGKHAVKFLKEYITKVRPHNTKRNKKSRHLFVNQLGNPIKQQTIIVIVREYAKRAKINKQVTTHTFRHTFASQLVKNGADISYVQKMMGHEDIRTTQIYVRSLVLNVKKIHSKTHPREKDKEKIKSTKPATKKAVKKK